MLNYYRIFDYRNIALMLENARSIGPDSSSLVCSLPAAGRCDGAQVCPSPFPLPVRPSRNCRARLRAPDSSAPRTSVSRSQQCTATATRSVDRRAQSHILGGPLYCAWWKATSSRELTQLSHQSGYVNLCT